MWLFKIIILGIPVLANALFRFVPERLAKKPYTKLLGIIVALFLVGQYFVKEIGNYKNYSYAQISESGKITDSTNFDYEVRRSNDRNGSPQYIILRKANLNDLTINTTNAVSPALSVTQDGVLIKFIGVGYGTPIVTSDFKIEIVKK